MKEKISEQRPIPLDITFPTRVAMALRERQPNLLKFDEITVTKYKAILLYGRHEEAVVYSFGLGIAMEGIYIFCSVNKKNQAILKWLAESIRQLKQRLGNDIDILTKSTAIEIWRTVVQHKNRKYISEIEFKRIVSHLDHWIQCLKSELDKRK